MLIQSFNTVKGKRVVPHILSFSRLALGVGFYLVIMRKTPVYTSVALGFMILSLLTDYWDGKLARRHDTVTMLGKWIDPFSDFLFFLAVYTAFYSLRLMPLVLLILFLVRELSMYTIIRPLYMVKKLDPAAKLPGKIKMVGQISGSIFIIVCLFFYQVEALPFLSLPGLRIIALCTFSLLIAMSLISLYWYIKPLVGTFETDRVNSFSAKTPEWQRNLHKAVILMILYLFLAQIIFFGVISFAFNIKLQRFIGFLLSAAAYHVLFYLGLYLVRREFFLESSDQSLTGINLPLFLSFLRFSSVPTVLFLLLAIDKVPVWSVIIPFLCLIFLTDLFDGILARRLGQTTRVGRILDSSSDYLVITVISILYLVYHLVPLWFFVLLSARLAVQCIGNLLLYYIAGYKSLQISFLGKASIFSVMFLYPFELIEFLKVPILGNSVLITVLELTAAGFIALSLGEKLIQFKQAYAAMGKGSEKESTSRAG